MISSFVRAQGDFSQGYVVKNNGDSIAGLVDSREMPIRFDRCLFKEQKGTHKQKFSPGDLKAYGFVNGRRYESKILNDDTQKVRFIQVIVKGRINLYSLGNKYYVQVEHEVMKGLSKGDYIDILNPILSACGLSASETKYSETSLTRLVQNYNRCKGGAGIVYQEKMPGTTLNYQLFAGVSKSHPKADRLNNDDAFPSSQTIVGGGSIDLSISRLSRNTFFSIETWYTNNTYQGYSATPESNGLRREDFIIRTSYLKVPIGVRYNLLKMEQSPYLKFGFVQHVRLSSSLKMISEDEFNSVVTTSIYTGELNMKNQRGFWISAGYAKINIGYTPFFEVRYEKTKGYWSSGMRSNVSITDLQLLFGLRF